MVQSHTILRSLAYKYADEPVLVLGGINDAVRKVAEGRVRPFARKTVTEPASGTASRRLIVLSTFTRRIRGTMTPTPNCRHH